MLGHYSTQAHRAKENEPLGRSCWSPLLTWTLLSEHCLIPQTNEDIRYPIIYILRKRVLLEDEEMEGSPAHTPVTGGELQLDVLKEDNFLYVMSSPESLVVLLVPSSP